MSLTIAVWENQLGKAYPRDFVPVENELRKVRQARSRRAQRELTNRRFEFQENLRALFAERAESGVPLTEKELEDINTSIQEPRFRSECS